MAKRRNGYHCLRRAASYFLDFDSQCYHWHLEREKCGESPRGVEGNAVETRQGAKEIVPSDIIELKVGDKVPADLRILQLITSTVRVLQSSLTGESIARNKGHHKAPDFIKVGADIFSVHCEQYSTIHLHRTVSQIKSLGAKARVVLNPATPLSCIEYVLDVVDLVLIMSVNLGFGGQSFIESQVKKISYLRRMCAERGVNPWIEVDGGVTPSNAYKVIEAGANALVVGSAVFGAKDYVEAIKGIKTSKKPTPVAA